MGISSAIRLNGLPSLCCSTQPARAVVDVSRQLGSSFLIATGNTFPSFAQVKRLAHRLFTGSNLSSA